MTKQKIVPLGKKVLIKDSEPSQYYPGTEILIPEIKKEYIAKVIAIGEDVDTVKIGDTVKYNENATVTELNHEGQHCLLLNIDMIFAKIVSE